MEDQNSGQNNKDFSEIFFHKNTLALLSLGFLLVFLVLIGVAYYWVSQKTKASLVFPAGINYLGPQLAKTGANITPVPTIDLTKLGASGKWSAANGRFFRYSFIFPSELSITTFPNDPTDKIAWWTGIVPAERNIFSNVESISGFDPRYTGKPEEFVKNFWKKYGGLSGVKSFERYQNGKGLEGYKVLYNDKAGKIATTNYFFLVPGDPDHILQVSNGILPEDIFNKIINSVEFKK